MLTVVRSILKNWETTAAGLGMIFMAIIPLFQIFFVPDGDAGSVDWNTVITEVMEGLALIFGGFGLISARTAWKSSKDSGIADIFGKR